MHRLQQPIFAIILGMSPFSNSVSDQQAPSTRLRTKTAWTTFLLIEIAAAALLFNSSFKEAAIMDELAHIPAGYGYVKYFDFRLNPEHPPLVKALAAIPLLFQDLNFPTNQDSWQTYINGQWDAGRQFLYESGNDADQIINGARVGPILLTLLLILVVYLWSKELLGAGWALLPTALIAFSPTVLAHGHYVTTDVGAALGIFIATFTFIKYLDHKTGKWLIIAGLAFGTAQLMKFSAVLLIPFFFAIAFFVILRRLYTSGWKGAALAAGNFIASFAGIFIVGLLLIYAVYFIFTLNEPIEIQYRDTATILQSFNGGPDPEWKSCSPASFTTRCIAEIDIWMSQNKVFRPLGEYLLGVLMVGQRASGGNTGYFLGEVSAAGWWYYFPLVFLLKEPLPSLLLIALIFLLTSGRIIKNRNYTPKAFFDYMGLHLAEFSMLLFFTLYWIYSIRSPLNIGVRHILPTLPFLYILVASGVKNWVVRRDLAMGSAMRKFFMTLGQLVKTSAKGLILAILVIWYLGEALITTPHYLSYFNQIGGGTNNGFKYVTDSNYDWGQDLKYLTKWAEENKIQKIAVDYFGGGNPRYYLGDDVVDYWGSSQGSPLAFGIEWFAVSINSIQNAKGTPAPGFERKPEDTYPWLTNPYEPYARAGKSIFIYKL